MTIDEAKRALVDAQTELSKAEDNVRSRKDDLLDAWHKFYEVVYGLKRGVHFRCMGGEYTFDHLELKYKSIEVHAYKTTRGGEMYKGTNHIYILTNFDGFLSEDPEIIEELTGE